MASSYFAVGEKEPVASAGRGIAIRHSGILRRFLFMVIKYLSNI
jgi:hypothetical protein